MNYYAIAAAAFAGILILYVFFTYNSFIHLKASADEAFSTMDVYLKKRWDLIPNLIETVKGYSGYEKSTLEALVALRSKPYDEMSNRERLETGGKLANIIAGISATAEAYPELKANTMFLNLSAELESIENDIANSRKYFNGVVRMWNIKVQSVPSNLVAKMFHFTQIPMYSISSEERENVKISL